MSSVKKNGRRLSESASLAKSAAWGGVSTAAIVLLMFVSKVSPTADFALFTLMSTLSCIAIIELGDRSGPLIWVASSLLGALLIGLPYMWQFVVFFGVWPMIKSLIERRVSLRTPLDLMIGLGLKALAFAFLLILAYLLITAFVPSLLYTLTELVSLPSLLIFILAMLICFIYDWVLTQLISFYSNRIRAHLARGGRRGDHH